MKTSGVSLADKLKLSDLPLATTPGGRAFSMKALHPAEHTIKSARVPGGNLNSVAVCCDMVQTIPVAEANDQVDIYVTPSIISPCCIKCERGGSAYLKGNMYNAAFGGAWKKDPTYHDTQSFVAKLRDSISHYRVTSQSVTVELIAPSLADQGTCTAVQYNLPPQTVQMSNMRIEGSTPFFVVHPDAHVYPNPQDPAGAILGTSAYTSKAREGCYLPLKLNNFKWRNFNDRVFLFEDATGYIGSDYRVTSGTAPIFFPMIEDRTGLEEDESFSVPKLCGTNFGVIAFRGMAANVSLRVRVRQVVEISARPATTYAPLLEVALPPDDVAMKMYMEISARMMDAYPASYNDLGILGNIITGLGKKLLPFVEPALDVASKIPGVGGAIASVAKPIVSTVAKVVADKKAKKKAAKAAANGNNQ